MIEWARSTGKKYGLGIVIKASETGAKNRRPRMRFACERSGQYRKFVKTSDDEDREVKRRPNATGTKKCGCPFELKCVQGIEGWTVSVFNGMHNHPSTLHMGGHSYARRLSSDQTSKLVELSKSLVKPKDILDALKNQDPMNVCTIKSVYNSRHKHRVREQGKSQMQKLMSRLVEHNYIEWHRTNDATGCVTEIFWSHPTAGDLLRAFPRVLLMDCTYKTNMYKFSLLEIVGVTSTELTFSVAFVLMECEKEDNYTWVLEKLKGMMVKDTLPTEMVKDALPTVIVTERKLALMNAIATVFPDATNLLCRWHIEKNVLAKCKKMFDNNKWEAFLHGWNTLVLSSSIAAYEEHLRALKRDFGMYPAALDYVECFWLGGLKERFVGAWMDSVMHFGNVTSNR